MTTLMLLSYGISVRKSSETLLIESKYVNEETNEKITQKVSVRQLTGVVCDSHVYISNPARILLLSHSIPIVLLDNHKVIGVTHPFHAHGTVITRREQFIAFNDQRGINLAKEFVQGPLNTKANLLLSYAKNRSQNSPDLAEIITKTAHEIRNLTTMIPEIEGDLSDIRAHLMGIEGQGTHLYYQAISQLLDPRYKFSGRQKRPPPDPINAALSYGYIILNSRCLIQTVTCGLDPYGGYLHVDRSGRPSLAIDLSEEFRQPIIDRVVFELAISSQFDLEDDFSYENGKVLLTKSGKHKFFQKLEERFTTRLPYNGKHYTLEQIILLQVRRVIHYLLGKASSYIPFYYGW